MTERTMRRFVEEHDDACHYGSLGNVTPADMYDGRQSEILGRHEKIKRRTLARRKKEILKQAA